MTALDGAPFRLAALAARRFPEGEALGAYLDGDAGLADYLRCGEPGCEWGRTTDRHDYCRYHAAEQTAANKRAYKARQRDGDAEPPPDCCGNPPPWPRKVQVWQDDGRQADARGYEATAHELARGHRADPRPLRMLGAPSRSTRFTCGQHKDAHDTSRGYGNSWATGGRGAGTGRGQVRVEWLYSLFGQDGESWRVRDITGGLDWSDDGRNDRLRGTRTLYPDLRSGDTKQWFAAHSGWVNHPLPAAPQRTVGRKRLTASWLRPELDRLGEIHRIRRVNGYEPWLGENVRVLVEGALSGIT